MNMKSLAVVLLLAAGGCGTFNETPYPSAAVSQANGEVTVAVNGFESLWTNYIAVHGWQTVYVPGYWGPHHAYAGHLESVPTYSYLPQTRTVDTYRARAREAFERAGFTIAAPSPAWAVEVRFEGPFVTTKDSMCEFAWLVGTIFFCDYATQTWRATLKVRDNRTGKLAFEHVYEQRYDTHAWGLIPILSVSACEETKDGFLQNWCLSALTDRVVADATSFLTGRK